MEALDYIKKTHKEYIDKSKIDNNILDEQSYNYTYYKLLYNPINVYLYNEYKINNNYLSISHLINQYQQKYTDNKSKLFKVLINKNINVNEIIDSWENIHNCKYKLYIYNQINNIDVNCKIIIKDGLHLNKIKCNEIKCHNCLINNLQLNYKCEISNCQIKKLTVKRNYISDEKIIINNSLIKDLFLRDCQGIQQIDKATNITINYNKYSKIYYNDIFNNIILKNNFKNLSIKFYSMNIVFFDLLIKFFNDKKIINNINDNDLINYKCLKLINNSKVIYYYYNDNTLFIKNEK